SHNIVPPSSFFDQSFRRNGLGWKSISTANNLTRFSSVVFVLPIIKYCNVFNFSDSVRLIVRSKSSTFPLDTKTRSKTLVSSTLSPSFNRTKQYFLRLAGE